MTQRIPVTIVNHVAIDISRPPCILWAEILAEYVEARKFSEAGYAVEPLADPAAFLGGYRLRYLQDGAVLDERVCRITELDASSRRLSMVADYLSVPGGMTVHATYRAHADPSGSRFTVDCYASLLIDLPGDGSSAAVARTVDAMTTQYEAALLGYLQAVEDTLEAQA